MSNSVTLWTIAHQAPLWSTLSWSFLKFMFIEPVMLYNHLILWHPLLLLPSIFSSIRVFSNELALCIRWPKHLSFSFNGFHDSSVGEKSTWNSGDPCSIPGLRRSTGKGIGYPLQYSWIFLVAQLVKNQPAVFDPWIGKIPWRRERLPTPVFWSGEYHGLHIPWSHKESDQTEWLSLHFSSASVLPMNIQDRFPLGLTGLIFFLSERL